MNLIFLLFISNGITQQEIAKSLNMSMPTVIQYLKEFRENNLLIETKSLKSSGGRRPKAIEFNYDSRYSLGVKIMKESQSIIITNMIGTAKDTIQYRRRFEHSKDYWEELSFNINKIISNNNISHEDVIGIGLALPCFLLPDKQRIGKSAVLPELSDIPYDEIQKYFKLPVFFERAAVTAGYAEAWVRAKFNNVAYISVSNEISGSIITKNGVTYGNKGRLGDFGHTVIYADGKQCACGRKGCIEAYCSTEVLAGSAGGSLETFWKMLEEGMTEAVKVFDDYLRDLAVMIANIHIALDCDIVIGGDVMTGLSGRFEQLIHYLDKEDSCNDGRDYLSLSRFGEAAEAAGAAILQSMDYLTR